MWWRLRAAFVAIGCCGVAVAGCSHAGPSAPAAGTLAPVVIAGDARAGRQLFAANCAACHGATGVEGGVGPSLKGERTRKNDAAAIAWIEDPLPPMPKLYPVPLTDADVVNLAAYVESL
jgi:mono/diheme cytochrome c family protein